MGTDEFPLYLINNVSITLNRPEGIELLERVVQKLKPVLVIIDPIYMFFEGNLSDSTDMIAMLKVLKALKEKYDFALINVTHNNKSTGRDAIGKDDGDKMFGTVFQRANHECACYLSRLKANGEIASDDDDPLTTDDEDQTQQDPLQFVVTREFRAAGAFGKRVITITMAPMGELGYSISVTKYKAKKTKEIAKAADRESNARESEIIRFLEEHVEPEKAFTKTELSNALSVKYHHKAATYSALIDSLRLAGHLKDKKTTGGFKGIYLPQKVCRTVSEEEHAKNVAAV